MATAEHLKLLKEAMEKKEIEIWNNWREENPDVTPDLSRGKLRDADLGRVNLKKADLAGADLSGSNLNTADFSGANLTGALLLKTNLKGAHLSRFTGPTPSEIKTTRNWEIAYYDSEMLERLEMIPGQ